MFGKSKVTETSVTMENRKDLDEENSLGSRTVNGRQWPLIHIGQRVSEVKPPVYAPVVGLVRVKQKEVSRFSNNILSSQK